MNVFTKPGEKEIKTVRNENSNPTAMALSGRF